MDNKSAFTPLEIGCRRHTSRWQESLTGFTPLRDARGKWSHLWQSLRRRWHHRWCAGAMIQSPKGGLSLTGFTLIEVVVVMVIISILAALIAVNVIDRIDEAKQVKTQADIKTLESALRLFKIDNGFYPSTEQGMRALVEKPSEGMEAKDWRESGYLEKRTVPLDPWDNEYVYVSPGVHNRDFDIVSFGRDGQEGGEGPDRDIANWAEEIDNY